MRRALLPGLGLFLASGSPVLACPSCFGQAEGPLIDAARLGIWLLLAVTLGLQGAFAVFFLYLRRRAATAHAATDERESRLRHAGERSVRSS